MCVTYQFNLIIQFSDNLCDKSGELYHCIKPFSDNVCDISGQLPFSIFWQCVWHINLTLSSNFLTMCVTNQANCITVSSHFPTMSVTYQVNYLVKFSDNVCDASSQPYHLIFWQCVSQIRQTVSLNHSIFRQCLWHIRSTTLLNFLTMCVTYQFNLIIQFSDNVCDKSGKLYHHFIIQFSDNVRDISGELPC